LNNEVQGEQAEEGGEADGDEEDGEAAGDGRKRGAS
jgi:hypothetical protein